MATLLFKVFTLTVKTASKPLAAQFERYVMGHPFMRKRVISIAQVLHRFDVSLTRSAEGKSGRAFVGDMSEEKAVQLASKVVSEGFVYGTAIILLLLEMDRKSKEDAVKKAKSDAQAAQVRELHERHVKAESDLKRHQEELVETIRRIENRLGLLEEQIQQSHLLERKRWLF